LGDLTHGFEKLAAGIVGGRALARGVQATAVLQAQLGIETEEVGRAHGAIGSGNGLALVEQVGEREVHFGGQLPHVVEGVFRVVGGIVGHDRDAADAQPGKFAAVAQDTRKHRLDIWTMIADEHDQQACRAAATGQAVGLAVDTGEDEIRSRPAKVALRCGETDHDLRLFQSLGGSRIIAR